MCQSSYNWISYVGEGIYIWKLEKEEQISQLIDPFLLLTAGEKMSLDKKAYKFKPKAEKLFWTLWELVDGNLGFACRTLDF